MRISLKIAPAAVLTATALVGLLAGCAVIPPADPARMQGYPQPAAAPPPAPRPPAPPPETAYPAPAAPVPYTPAQTYTPPPAQPYTPSPAASELPPASPLTYASIGRTVTVGGPRITPIAVLEDSRCPMNARCVWAGQVRLRVRIESGTGGEVELTSGKPASVADGTLELVEVQPDKTAGAGGGGAIAPSAYRFGFRFSGGY